MEIQNISKLVENSLGGTSDELWHLDKEELKLGFRNAALKVNPDLPLQDTLRLYQRLRNQVTLLPEGTRTSIAKEWLPQAATAERPKCAAAVALEFGAPNPLTLGRLIVLDTVLERMEAQRLEFSQLISRYRREGQPNISVDESDTVRDPLTRACDWDDLRYLALLSYRTSLLQERKRELIFPDDLDRKQITPKFIRHAIRAELEVQRQAGVKYGKWSRVAEAVSEKLGITIGTDRAKKIMEAAANRNRQPKKQEPRSHIYSTGEDMKLLYIALDPDMQEAQSTSVGLGLVKMGAMADAFNEWRRSVDPECIDIDSRALRNHFRKKVGGGNVRELLVEPLVQRRETAIEAREQRSSRQEAAIQAAVAAGYDPKILQGEERRKVISGLSCTVLRGITPFTKEETDFLRAVHDQQLCRHPKGGFAKVGTVDWPKVSEEIKPHSPQGAERTPYSLRNKYHRLFGKI